MNILKNIVESADCANRRLLKEYPYGTKKELNNHIKHRDGNPLYQNISDNDFDTMGDYLYTAPVDNKNIFGYMTVKNGKTRYCKWDKRNRLFVCYEYRNNIPTTVSSYMKSRKNYEADAYKQKSGEVPKGK